MSEKHPLDEQPWQPILEQLPGFNPFSNSHNPGTDPFPSSVLDDMDEEPGAENAPTHTP
jgi:hypothetical protein